MDLRPFGLNWQIDPANKDSVVPADFLTKISLATNPGPKTVTVNKIDGTQVTYTLGKRLGGGTFGQVFECSTPTNNELVIKVIDLAAGNLDVQSILIETIIQIIVVNETRTSSYPDLKISGPFAPEVYDVSYDATTHQCYIVTQKMRKTLRALIDGWAPPKGTIASEQIGKNISHLLIRINKVLHELYNKLQYNHRDFKTDNCMYIRDVSDNFIPRIIDFGFSCITFKGLRISVGEKIVQFRYCNLLGRDMSQFIYEIAKYRPWLPNSFKDVLSALLTIPRGKKVYKLLDYTNVKSWGETYYFMNSSQENYNCTYFILENVLSAYERGGDWKRELVFKEDKKKRAKKTHTPKPVAPAGPKACPADKPDYNPKTKRCVKLCPPGKERDPASFKCIKKTVKAPVAGCPPDKPDYNPKTKRCLKSCPADKIRDKDFKCVKKVVAKVCPPEKPDYNPKTKRCVKSCPPGKKRNASTFKCK